MLQEDIIRNGSTLIERLTKKGDTMGHMVQERRHFLRFGLNRGVHFIYCQASYLVGKLTNISQTGLSFEYSTTHVRTSEKMKIDVLSSQHELTQLSRLTCLRIYDLTGLVEQQSFRGSAIRQCGVSFEGLTKAQQSELFELINKESGSDLISYASR